MAPSESGSSHPHGRTVRPRRPSPPHFSCLGVAPGHLGFQVSFFHSVLPFFFYFFIFLLAFLPASHSY